MEYLKKSGLQRFWNGIKNLFIKKESFEDAGITSKHYTLIDTETVTTVLGSVHPKPYAALSNGTLTRYAMYRVTFDGIEYELPCYLATLTLPDLSTVANMSFIGNPTYFDGNDDYIGEYWDVPFLISDSVQTSAGSNPVSNGPYIFTNTAQTVSISIEEIAYSGNTIPDYLIDGDEPDLVKQNEAEVRSSSFGYNRIQRSILGATAIGTGNKITGAYGTAIGTGNEAGPYAMAIGVFAKATGYYAISIGWKTDASGAAAFASGAQTVASGNQSSTFGNRTIANHKSQFVFGEYNEADPSSAAASARGNYAEIVGNGSGTNARSNARMLGWDGHEYLSGGLTLGYGTNDESYLSPSRLKSMLTYGGTKVYTISYSDISWNAAGTEGQTYWPIDRDEILSLMASNIVPIFNVYVTDYQMVTLFPFYIDNDDEFVFYQSFAHRTTGYYYCVTIETGLTPQVIVFRRAYNFVSPDGTTGQVLTKTANGYSWQGIPKQVHLVGMDSITWATDTSATGEVSETRAQILSWLNSGDLVFLNVGDSSDPIWLFPQYDDTEDIYFGSVVVFGQYYEAWFHDSSTTRITVKLVEISQVPSGGSVGQVLTKTANGYTWQNLPVYNGGFT